MRISWTSDRWAMMGNDGQKIIGFHRYDEPGAAPSGFMIGGVPTGVIDERDPEKRHGMHSCLDQSNNAETCKFYEFL